MTDALLLLLSENAHPDTCEDTARAALQLRGVTHVHRLTKGAIVDVAQVRAELAAFAIRMDAERAARGDGVDCSRLGAEVYDDGA